MILQILLKLLTHHHWIFYWKLLDCSILSYTYFIVTQMLSVSLFLFFPISIYAWTCIYICMYNYAHAKTTIYSHLQWPNFWAQLVYIFLSITLHSGIFVCLNELSPAFAWICSLRFHEVSSWWIHKPELQLSCGFCCVKKRNPSFSYWWMAEINSPMPARHPRMTELLLNLHKSLIIWSGLRETNRFFTGGAD